MTTSRRRRWDAERNRRRLLEAASAVLDERGLSADVREIVGRAGVGIATFYRHFPTKDELVRATLEHDLAEWTTATRAAEATEDAWFGLTLVIEQTLAVMARHRAVLEGFGDPSAAPTAFAASLMRLRAALDGLVGRAHAQGTLRLDVSSADIGLLIMALGRVVQLTAARGAAAEAVWRRHTGLVLDGLHTHAVRG